MDIRNFQELKTKLRSGGIDSNLDFRLQGNKEVVISVEARDLKSILLLFRDDEEFVFKILTDLFAIDYPAREKRFSVIYNLLSIENNDRICIEISIKDGEFLPSIDDIYSSANWYEREVFDMYGICFDKSKDLRRILTDYGFEGHPLRKDFPLTGFKEVRYDIEKKKVIYENVSLPQDYRNFDFLSPWEGVNYSFVKEQVQKSDCKDKK